VIYRGGSITFEPVPSDYAIPKLVTPPEDAGGDTVWASGYQAYNRLSPAWKKFAEGLTATHYQRAFNDAVRHQNMELIIANRGNPENSGVEFKASHSISTCFSSFLNSSLTKADTVPLCAQTW
jgi:hypothetical protein